ncbi:magnesium/cobalt transporter CorA [Aminobacter sp. NyZ550]|jgi:magnesium transporter|uniref:Magnesium transport protein CorA n=2 Tax=Aminobacter TaxID=31988 RepID=A0AAC9FDG2_AMIAI|nr:MULTISPECIES: magnesium/cobalt transporter CorA [Aminobacter]AMS41340.1 magnesium transporter [Aminobacter aminovorans]MBA8904593.1 magnesium transporter [Aminobacter ciceronei]MBA9018371.1 magnesium transporter [Aminobacter ciceronei]MBB3707907.1 magnesium transporter [Aminobacter aminovorans]MRX32976.1 magnesium/cobalt transporter CorA [Aminobacter sp. MDW-2]
MIKAFVVENDRLRLADSIAAAKDSIVWADLLNPTREEEAEVEQWLGVGVPTREEMEEIEISSRLYVEDGAYFMTATLPSQADSDDPVMSPVTFVLRRNLLVTIRYHEPKAFLSFPVRAEKAAIGCTSGETILVGLLEAIVDRLADVLERVSRDIELLSKDIFNPTATKASKRDRDFQQVLKTLGRKESLTSNIRDSLTSLQRLSGFLANALAQGKNGKDAKARVKTLSRDVLSLTDHASFLSQKITFLLDATLGMINIEQNGIIKIVSVAAVVFLPPTLVASIYGMNFDLMPELRWMLGYPMAIGLMVISAVLPFWWFRRRGWL